MATIVDRISFADEICNILKIEHVNITKIEIIVTPRDFVEVIIHKAMTMDEGNSILKELKTLKQ